MTNTGRTRAAAVVSRALALPVLAGLLLAGCAAGQPADEADARRPTPSVSPTPSPAAPTPAAPAPEVPDVPIADASLDALETAAPITPVRITVPDLSIDMAIEAEGLDAEGAMALPEDAATAGWYQFGPGLREAAGATVIAAHIDSRHDGIGPFSRLKDAAVGTVVNVTADDGTTVAYSVTEVRSVGKIDAPMAEVFDRAGSPRLTLITCGGVFDSSTGHYLDNVLVTAIPVT